MPAARVSRLANSQGKRPLAMVQTESGQLLLAPDAAERLDVLLGLLLDHVDDVVEGDDADQPLFRRPPEPRPGCSARTGARPPPGRRWRTRRSSSSISSAIGTGRLVRSSRSSATVPRAGGPDRPHRSPRNGPADRASRACSRWSGPRSNGRHRDELGLHAPAGRIFRVVQAALQRDALGRRQLLEDLGLVVLRQVFEDVDRVVGIEVAHALGDGLGRQLLEDFLADRVVDLGQRREVERAPSARSGAGAGPGRAPRSDRRDRPRAARRPSRAAPRRRPPRSPV